jgi:hypothetical protein
VFPEICHRLILYFYSVEGLDSNFNFYDQYYSSVFAISNIYLSFSFLFILSLLCNCTSYVSLINFVFILLFRKGTSLCFHYFNFQGDIFFSS